MTTLSSLVARTRIELGDIGKSFVWTATADGVSNRYNMHYAPLDGANVIVMKNNVDISSAVAVEESTGVLVFDTVPALAAALSASGTYYRYFTYSELSAIVQTAFDQHTERHVDVLGRKVTLDNLSTLDEYPIVIWATSIALYTLATDAAFDIDIQAPDGVTIPRSERYRQLMEMIQTRKDQYRELCSHLGIGLFTVDVFNLNRISKATGRLIPKYVPQEVDDRSYPERVHTILPTYGNTEISWPTDAGELTCYQTRPFEANVNFTGNYTDYSFTAKLLNQRGSVAVARYFTLYVSNTGTNYTANLKLDGDQTTTLAERTYWSLVATSPVVTVTGGNNNISSTTITISASNADIVPGILVSFTGVIGTVRVVSVSGTTVVLDYAQPIPNGTTITFGGESNEIKGGNFFTARISSIVI